MKAHPITRYLSVGGRNLAVELTPDWAEVYLYCEDILRLVRRVPRRDLPSDIVGAFDALLEPLRKRFTNRPMSREDLAWAMRQRLLAKMGIEVTLGHAYLVRGGMAIPCSWVMAIDLVALWRIQRHLRSPQPHPALWGLRSWSFDGQVLRSPTMYTPWPTPVLQARDLDPSSIVEGKAGIHALHAFSASTLHQALHAGCYILATRDYLHTVWGLVRPYGKTVIGPLGWRAEFAQIVALMTSDPSCLPMLEERYGVPCFLCSVDAP